MFWLNDVAGFGSVENTAMEMARTHLRVDTKLSSSYDSIPVSIVSRMHV